MLSKNDIKDIKSLEQKKFRTAKGLFVAEGHKLVNELLGKFRCVLAVATNEWDRFGSVLIMTILYAAKKIIWTFGITLMKTP